MQIEDAPEPPWPADGENAARPTLDFDRIATEVLALATDCALRLSGDADLADEVAQRVAIDLWARRRDDPHAWDPAQPLEPYVRKAVRYQLIDNVRDQKRAEAKAAAVAEEYALHRPTVAQQPEVTASERMQVLFDAALRSLPPSRRAIWLAVRSDGRTAAEVATSMGITRGTVKQQLHRAARVMEQALIAYESEAS